MNLSSNYRQNSKPQAAQRGLPAFVKLLHGVTEQNVYVLLRAGDHDQRERGGQSIHSHSSPTLG